MRVTIFGTGYVGLVTGTCLAEVGHDVICVDIDNAKVEGLNRGVIPIYEPGLESMVKANHASGRLNFTTDAAAAIEHGDVVFIAVGTPPDEDGSADLKYVLAVARTIGQHVQRAVVVVNKSTVPVGTADKVRATIAQELVNRRTTLVFDVVSNPEFLKEGDAVNDCMRPDRIVIGTDSAQALEKLKRLYAPFNRNHERIVAMDVRSAELTKYAANAMLATKISFMNEMACIAEQVGADIEHVRQGIGSDPRIGWHFIYPGAGYGGSCFPKDVQALAWTAQQYGCNPRLLDAVEAVNAAQKQHLFELMQRHFPDGVSRQDGRRVGPVVQAEHRRHARRLQPHAARAVVGSRCARAGLRSGSHAGSAPHLRQSRRPASVRDRGRGVAGCRRTRRRHRVEAVPQPGFRQARQDVEGQGRLRRSQSLRPGGSRSRGPGVLRHRPRPLVAHRNAGLIR